MNHQQALAALTAIAIATGATAGVGLAQTTAGTKATVANETGNPIDAPETVDPGQQLDVSVSGAAEGASIEVWGPVTQSGKGERIMSVPLTGGTAMLTAPQVSASYEMRYVGANGRTRALRSQRRAASCSTRKAAAPSTRTARWCAAARGCPSVTPLVSSRRRR